MLTPKFISQLLPKYRRLPQRILLIFISTWLGLTAALGLLLQNTPLSQAAAPRTIPPQPASVGPVNLLQPQLQITSPITPLDIVVVFDISGSTEDQTICHDCWVRTSYNPDYPNNGYFNPIPFDTRLAPPNTPNLSIPQSQLCTNPPTPWLEQNGSITYSYLTVEAELYSANWGNWNLDAHAPGQGFWAIQRGSRGSTVPPGISPGEATEYQGNRAGAPAYQSSNLCHPALTNAINCTINTANATNDDVCRDDSAIDNNVDVIRDCSSYISARPFTSYSQMPGYIPNPTGASYNLACFLPGAGPFTPPSTVLSGRCWTNDRIGDGDFNNPFYDPINGPLREPGPSNVPWVEYDFTPTWPNSTTYIWIRAAGGGTEAFTYAGPSPDNLNPDSNGGGVSNNLSLWNDKIFWQINQGEVFWQNGGVETWGNWQDNRAEPSDWRWIRLGSTSTVSGAQYTLRLFQGSPGYKVDKIVFTNDPSISDPPALWRRLTTAEGGSGGTAGSDGRDAVGPPASYGSATREACNVCNPIYGNTVNTADCSCLKNVTEAKKRYDPGSAGYDPTFYGTGTRCSIAEPGGSTSMLVNVVTVTVSPPEVQPPQVQTITIVRDLYSGLQPIRSAQETVKNFVLGVGAEEQYRLKPGFDQVRFAAFTTNVISTDATRSKLQCLRTKNPPPADASACYADVLAAVERQWPNNSTSIAEGLREGLEELGVSVGSNTVDNTCTGGVNSGHACDRGGAAKRVLILMTDGSPNVSPSGCTSQPGYGDYWEGLVGNENTHFECAMWYAQQAAAKGVIVYTVGIGGGANADYLTTMATGIDPRSGGTPVKMFEAQCGQYFAVATPADLDGVLIRIPNHARNCEIKAPVLSVTKSVISGPAILGQVLTYALTVTNSGVISASGAIITDTLDSSVSFAWASDGGGYNGNIVTWNVGAIPPHQTITRTLVVTVGTPSNGNVLTNTAWLTSSEGIRRSSTITTTVGSALIWPVNGYEVLQYSYDDFVVHLENHASQAGPYDIYLDDSNGHRFKICELVYTGFTTHNGDYNCPIGETIPAGSYQLYSTLADSDTIVALAPQAVTITINPTPLIFISGGNVWAANSSISLTLVAHQAADEPFELYFDYGGPYSQTIATNLSATPAPIAWKAPAVGSLCPIGGSPCTVESRRAGDPTELYVSTDLYINQPELVVPGGKGPYANGETIYIYLKGHTPETQYDLKISGPAGSTYLGRTELTDALGDSPGPMAWVLTAGWPNGLYTLSSHPAAKPYNLSNNTQIAVITDLQIKSPTLYLPIILK